MQMPGGVASDCQLGWRYLWTRPVSWAVSWAVHLMQVWPYIPKLLTVGRASSIKIL